VPDHVVAEWKRQVTTNEKLRGCEAWKRHRKCLRLLEHYLDEGHGSCFLLRPRVAKLVQDALLHFDGRRYRLLAWVVMPNHVHALVEQLSGYLLADVVRSWKSFTARSANQLLGRSGRFWQRDYHDRYVRDEKHLAIALDYIHGNPVKAGLVERAEMWRFSSAYSGHSADVGQRRTGG